MASCITRRYVISLWVSSTKLLFVLLTSANVCCAFEWFCCLFGCFYHFGAPGGSVGRVSDWHTYCKVGAHWCQVALFNKCEHDIKNKTKTACAYKSGVHLTITSELVNNQCYLKVRSLLQHCT